MLIAVPHRSSLDSISTSPQSLSDSQLAAFERSRCWLSVSPPPPLAHSLPSCISCSWPAARWAMTWPSWQWYRYDCCGCRKMRLCLYSLQRIGGNSSLELEWQCSFSVMDITFKYVPLAKAKNANLWKYFGFKSVFLCTVYSVIAALQHTPL